MITHCYSYKKTDVFADKLGKIPVVRFDEDTYELSFSRPIRGPLRCPSDEVAAEGARKIHVVDRRVFGEPLMVDASAPATPQDIGWFVSRASGSCEDKLNLPCGSVEGIEVRRASGAWKRLLTDDDLFHMANSNTASLVMKRRVTMVDAPEDRHGREEAVWKSPTEYADPGCKLLLFNGPEHTTDKFKGMYLATAEQLRSVLADGLVLCPPDAELMERAIPFGSLQVPKVHSISSHALRGSQPSLLEDSDTLDFFKRHGWMTMEMDSKMRTAQKNLIDSIHHYFDKASLKAKRTNAMDPDDRTYGWHHETSLGKESLRIRDVPTFKDNWREDLQHTGPSTATKADCFLMLYRSMNDCALPVAKKIFTEVLKLDSKMFTQIFNPRKLVKPTPQNEKYTSFMEGFRYSGNPLGMVHNKQDQGPDAIDGFVATAAHVDVSFITTMAKSSLKHGLQIKHEGEWLDAEKLLPDHHVLVFAGEMMDYMSRGTVPKVEHRVVMSAGAPPRYSVEQQVLPLPSAVLPRVDSGAKTSHGDNAAVDGLTGAQFSEWCNMK